MLERANGDQINAVSEMVLNLLRNRIPFTRSPWLNCNAIRQRYARWGNAETRSRGDEHISKSKKVADSGADCKTVSKHVFDERT